MADCTTKLCLFRPHISPSNPNKHHLTLNRIWTAHGGNESCQGKGDMITDKWDGMFEASQSLAGPAVYCDRDRCHSNRGTLKPPNKHYDTLKCPNGSVCKGIEIVDEDAFHFYWETFCRRYPDPGLCSVGLFKGDLPDKHAGKFKGTLRECHPAYLRSIQSGECNSKQCETHAYKFCVLERNGHWAWEVCIRILKHELNTDDANEHKERINALLVHYLKTVHEIEEVNAKKADKTQKDTIKAATSNLPTPVETSLSASTLGLPVTSDVFFKSLTVDESPSLPWTTDEKNYVDVIKSKDKARITQMLNNVRITPLESGRADKIKAVRRVCVGVEGQKDFVKNVLDKIFMSVDTDTTSSSFFPPYLPIDDDHIAMFAQQVIDPTSVWLVYPYDMSQTRHKTEAEYLISMKAILNAVDTDLILSSNESGVKYFEDYLKERCLPLAAKPGRDLFDEPSCRSWVKMNTLSSKQRDKVVDTFCMINNDAHAGSPECSCYWGDRGNDAPWKDTYGHRNYDMDKDPDPKLDHVKRMHSPICYLNICNNSGLQTQNIKADMELCPKCVSMNTVLGSNNKVNQANSCALKTENVGTIAGPNAAAVLSQVGAPTLAPSSTGAPTKSPPGAPTQSPPGAPTQSPPGAPTQSPPETKPNENMQVAGLMLGGGCCLLLCCCLVALIVFFIVTRK